MSTLQITLFGPPQLTVDGTPVDISRDKSMALLSYLVVTKNPHRRDRLASLLWPDADQSSARAYLRHAFYILTKHLGDAWIEADRRQITLRPEADVQVDVWQFGQLVESARDGDEPVVALAHAAALARDEFMAGFSLPDAPEFEEWQLFQRQNLHRQLGEVMQALVHHHRIEHEYEEAINCARRWVALDNLNELAHCILMQLYALSGQKAAALHQYDELVRLLQDEMDASPASETDVVYAAIREDRLRVESPLSLPGSQLRSSDDASLASEPDAAEAQSIIPHNLPQELTPFVGRERELADLDLLLDDEAVHLITIVGPGGMGKTRLGLACAEHQLQSRRFPHGIYLVELAALEDPSRLASAVASTLGYVPESGGLSSRPLEQQVAEYLRDREILLLLDNMEHLLEGIGLLSAVLRTAPGVRLLVTSRERLRMHAEHVYPIQGLAFEEPTTGKTMTDTPAVRLFAQSARHSNTDFALDADSRFHAAQICQLVEGMPLGIELAASWVNLIGLDEIAQEIRRSLTFLQTELRDVPIRHHSIQAVFDATWQRLDGAERSVFAALSVFRGGFTREAAGTVAGATLQQLSSLATKSLIQLDLRQRDPHSRYTVHELLRQYGALKLAEAPSVVRGARARHCAYFAAFLEKRLPAINGSDQKIAADEIAVELDNIRAAWQWALDQSNVQAIHQAAITFFLFCQLRSHFLDGADMMAAAATELQAGQASDLRDRTLAQVLNNEGWLRIRVGDFDRAVAVLEQSHEIYAQPDTSPPPPFLGTDPTAPLALVAQIRGEYDKARELGEAALEAAVAHNDPSNQSHAHYVLTSLCAAQGDYVAAAYHAEQACEQAQVTGNRWFLATPLSEWGKVARAVEDYAQAQRHFQASYDIKREFGDPEGMAVALSHMGEIAILRDNLDEATRLYREALALYEGLSDRVGLATVWFGMGRVACLQGDTVTAREWFQQALAVAWETQFLPLLFSIFIEIGDLLGMRDRAATAIAALAHVQQHPAADHETKSRANRALAQWRARVDPDLYHQALRQAGTVEIESVVTALQIELTLAA